MLTGLSLTQLLIYALIFFGALAIFWVVLTRGIGWTPPDWAIKCFWIAVAVIVGILFIKLLLSLA